MCTIGYHRKLKLLFKNRDKTDPVDEVVVIKPGFLAVKTEGAAYYSLGINRYSCSFASTAVNTAKWTALAARGRMVEARQQDARENRGLLSPTALLSRHLEELHSVDEMLALLLEQRQPYMGYNLLLADADKVVHVELHRDRHFVRPVRTDTVVTNHFQQVAHGPKKMADYPSSFQRLALAGRRIKRVVSIEDLFCMLKTNDQHADCNLWRSGIFATVSSSVIDIEARSLYHASRPEQNYARVIGDNLLRGGEKIFIEMSRYIDLQTYHNIERAHPFYAEMIDEIKRQATIFHGGRRRGRRTLRALEFGAGTGLCSLDLVKLPFLKLDLLEIDRGCCEILAAHPETKPHNIILEDAVTYCRPGHYDLVISTFAHDHIHYNKRLALARNIFNNLRPGGIYIMGGEMLPQYSDENSRKQALFRYHNHIIDLALRDGRVQLSELENNALKSGLDMVGDFKRHEKMFEEEMTQAGMKLVSKCKLGPLDRDNVGGVFVYVYKK